MKLVKDTLQHKCHLPAESVTSTNLGHFLSAINDGQKEGRPPISICLIKLKKCLIIFTTGKLKKRHGPNKKEGVKRVTNRFVLPS
jgi:hypothetical protein